MKTELLPDDGWAFFSRRASLFYALPILIVLGLYAHYNSIASVASAVSLAVLGLVFGAFLSLAGTSGQTWYDPLNAIGILLLAVAFLLDGFFIAGAATFGPTPVLDVGVGPEGRGERYFWRDGMWFTGRISARVPDKDCREFRRWADNGEYTNDLAARPARIQLSTWDGQVYCITMKSRIPPMTIGGAPTSGYRWIFEMCCGLGLVVFSFRVYRAGQKRGVRLKKFDSLLLG